MIDNKDIDTLARATAYGPDGDKLGRIGEVYLDNETGQPAWVTVITGLFGTRRHFVPIDDAELDSTGVRLPFDKDTVTGAPNIDENGELSPLEEEELYRYYRRDDARQTSTTPTSSTPTPAQTDPAHGGPTHAPTQGSVDSPGTIGTGPAHSPDEAPLAAPSNSPQPSGRVPAGEAVAGNYHPHDDAAVESSAGGSRSVPDESASTGTPDQPRGPRLVKRVVTTEYYSEEGDEPGK